MRVRLVASLALLASLGIAASWPPRDAAPPDAGAHARAPSTVEGSALAAQDPSPERPVILWVGGDVLVSGAMRRSARADGDPARGFARMLAPVAARWRQDPGAFVLVDLEMPVAAEVRVGNDAFRHLKRDGRRVRAPLNAPPWVLDGLRRAGVDAVTLANNHALDQGREGLAETLAAARGAGLVVTGAGPSPHHRWPIVLGEGASTTTVLSWFERDAPEPPLEPGTPGLSILGPAAADEVRSASREGHVVVVIHVVAELLDRPKPRWRELASDLARAGADAILFHGTHVPGPVERLSTAQGETVVAFGLGNLISDMGARATPGHDPPAAPDKWEDARTRVGLLARVEVREGSVAVSLLPVFSHHDRYLVHNFARRSEHIRFALVPLDDEGVEAALSAWPEPYRSDTRRWMHALKPGEIGLSPAPAGD